MKDLGLNEAQIAPRSRRIGDKSSKVRKSDAKCCNVDAIIGTMLVEQREHNFSKFGDAYIRDRKVVASWMIDVCEYFSLHPTTIHGAISYLDRLQPSDKHSRYEWKMFVVCCILISAKYNESETDVPDLETLEYLIQLPIPKDTLLNYELWTLQKLGWKLNVRSPLAFIACFVVCGVAFPSDECWDAEHKLLLTCHDLDRQITEECYAMASFALLEAPLKRHRASDVACGILYFVRRALGVSPVWVPELTALTRGCPSSVEVVLVLEAFDSLLLTSSPQDPTGEEIQGEIEREIQGEREIEREGVTEGEREIEREGVIKSEGVIEREGEKESVARVIMGTPVPQVSTSSSSSGRRAKERSEMEILLDQIASASLGTAEGRDRDRDRDQSSPGFEGQNTPEEKASRFNKAREGNVYPSPVSMLAVDSLEHFLEA